MKQENLCFLCDLTNKSSLSAWKGDTKKTFCESCSEKIKKQFLVYENNEFIGLKKKEECYSLIKTRAAKPRSYFAINLETDKNVILEKEDESIFYVFLMENGIKEIKDFEAKTLVKNKWAYYVNDACVKMTILRKKLIQSVLKRDDFLCRFCQTKTDCTIFSHPEKDESIATPLNAFCACPRCRTEYTKKDYFKWLSVDESEEEEIELVTFTKSKIHKLSYQTAEKLVQEKMATYTSDKKIKILYDKASFRNYIKKVAQNKCAYCKKNGSTIDHVFPKSKGGLTTPLNCVWSCEKCNADKANLTKDEFLR